MPRAKQKTQVEKLAERIEAKIEEQQPTTNIVRDSHFVGVAYPAEAAKAVSDVAAALQSNAEALNTLAGAIRVDNGVVDAMIKIEGA